MTYIARPTQSAWAFDPSNAFARSDLASGFRKPEPISHGTHQVGFAPRGINSAVVASLDGASGEWNTEPLPREMTDEIKLWFGQFLALPFTLYNTVTLGPEGRNGLDRDQFKAHALEFVKQAMAECTVARWILSQSPDSQEKKDLEKKLNDKVDQIRQYTRDHHQLDLLPGGVEGVATTVGSSASPSASSVFGLASQHQKLWGDYPSGFTDATITSLVGQAFGLVNSLCHVVRSVFEIARGHRQIDRLKAWEHGAVFAMETALSSEPGLKPALDHLTAAVQPSLKIMKTQGWIYAFDGALRAIHGGVGVGLKSTALAATIIGSAATFGTPVGIASSSVGAAWLGWQVFRLCWLMNLKTQDAQIDAQLANHVDIALATQKEQAHITPELAHWLEVIKACRGGGAEAMKQFLAAVGISQALIKKCTQPSDDPFELAKLLHAAFKEAMITATPLVTAKEVQKLKSSHNPCDHLKASLLLVKQEQAGTQASPRNHQGLGQLVSPDGLTSAFTNVVGLQEAGNYLRQIGTASPHQLRKLETELKRHVGFNAEKLLEFVDAARNLTSTERRQRGNTLLKQFNLYAEFDRDHTHAKALLGLSGERPDLWGRIFHRMDRNLVKETAQAFLRLKYTGSTGGGRSLEFEDKLRVATELSVQGHFKEVGFFKRLKTFFTTLSLWQRTPVALDMCAWMKGKPMGADLVAACCFSPTNEHARNLRHSLDAVDRGDVKALLSPGPHLAYVEGAGIDKLRNARAHALVLAEEALANRRGLHAKTGTAPMALLENLAAHHPAAAKQVLGALMGHRYQVTGLCSEEGKACVKTIFDAYSDSFLCVEDAGDGVIAVPKNASSHETDLLGGLAGWFTARRERRERLAGSPLFAHAELWENDGSLPAMTDQLKLNLRRLRSGSSDAARPSHLWTLKMVRDPVARTGLRAEQWQKLGMGQMPPDQINEIDEALDALHSWEKRPPSWTGLQDTVRRGDPISRVAVRWLLNGAGASGIRLTDELFSEIRKRISLGTSSAEAMHSIAEVLARGREDVSMAIEDASKSAAPLEEDDATTVLPLDGPDFDVLQDLVEACMTIFEKDALGVRCPGGDTAVLSPEDEFPDDRWMIV